MRPKQKKPKGLRKLLRAAKKDKRIKQNPNDPRVDPLPEWFYTPKPPIEEVRKGRGSGERPTGKQKGQSVSDRPGFAKGGEVMPKAKPC